MLTKHLIYKHKKFLNVAFMITDINNVTTEEFKVIGRWFTVTSMKKLHATTEDSFHIKISDVDNWYVYNQEE